jgi:hypothetical protein
MNQVKIPAIDEIRTSLPYRSIIRAILLCLALYPSNAFSQYYGGNTPYRMPSYSQPYRIAPTPGSGAVRDGQIQMNQRKNYQLRQRSIQQQHTPYTKF